MAQVSYFKVETDNARLAANCPTFEVDTLDAAMRDVQDFLTDRALHRYFPVRVELVDTDGRHTTVCRVSLS